MRRLTILLLIASGVFAIPPEPPAKNPADALAAAIREADSVTIQFYAPTQKEEVTFSDPSWMQKLSSVLAFASYQPQELCLCVSYPIIRLKREGRVVGSFSVHHGMKLRVFGHGFSGDFLIGEQTAKAVAALSHEKRANQALEPTTMAVTPRAPSPTSK